MAERKFPWKWVVIGGGALLLVALVVGYLTAMRTVVQAYYRAEYQPAELSAAELVDGPANFRLTDVTWYSEPVPLGATVSLRMLAAQQGRVEPRSVIDFWTGATWGATPIPQRTGFFPGQDAEPGLLRGATALGFTRRYLTTDDRALFVKALKHFLAKGRAVRVAVDRAMLLEQSGLVPHSLVLVGYEGDRFEYYEPWCDEPARCAHALEREPGTAGLHVPAERLALACESLALALQYPWKYQLVVLEKDPAAPAPALEKTLQQNGSALVGSKGRGPSLGVPLVESVAKALDTHGEGVVTPELLRGVKTAAAVRRDDAEALLLLFPGRTELAKTAEALDSAAKLYGEAATALEAKQLEAGVRALRAAAQADQRAGEAILVLPSR
ncbi:MAG: hypothetical protein ACOZQL_41855 [Myxococcota bacterium]